MNRKTVRISLLIVIVLQLVGIFDHSLWSPDEPRVAEIAREISETGEYVIPHLSKRPFLEKPPLYFATAGFFYHVFDTRTEGIGRLASVTFSLGTLAVVFFGIKRLMGEETGCLSTMILASSFLFFLVSHKMLVDNALVFFTTSALISFILGYKERLSWGFKVFWICLALAFMTKGAVGIGIPIVAVGLFMLWKFDFSVLKRMWLIPGATLVAVTMFTWGLILYLKGGIEYLNTFYVYDQIGRFLSSGIYRGGHIRPFYYYLKDIWADAAPWSIFLIPAFIRKKVQFDDTKRFMYSWFISGFILLSLASTKRGVYMLPMYPAMAFIIASWMREVTSNEISRIEKIFLMTVETMILIAGIVMPTLFVYIGGSFIKAFTTLAISAIVFWQIWKSKGLRPAYSLVIGWTVLLVMWTPVAVPTVDQMKTLKPFFTRVGREVAHKKVIGFELTETVEALSPFYGSFYVDNIENRDIFSSMLKEGTANYILVLPSRLDDGLKRLISSRYLLSDSVAHGKGPIRIRKDIELWRIKNSYKPTS